MSGDPLRSLRHRPPPMPPEDDRVPEHFAMVQLHNLTWMIMEWHPDGRYERSGVEVKTVDMAKLVLRLLNEHSAEQRLLAQQREMLEAYRRGEVHAVEVVEP